VNLLYLSLFLEKPLPLLSALRQLPPLLGLVITAVNETAHRFFSKGPRPTNAMSETWNKAWAVCLVMMFLSSSLTLAGK
jgi:hypothetical protein